MIFYSNRLRTSVSEKGRDTEIKVIKYPTNLGYFFGFNRKEYIFLGSCTVWYQIKEKSSKRASTAWEAFLFEVWNHHSKNKSSRR